MKNERFQEYAKGARFSIWALAVLVTYSLSSAAFTSLSTVGSGSGLTSSAWNLMVANLNDLNSRVNAISGIPTGTVIAFNGTSCPSGWTEAAGAGVPTGPGGSATLNLRGQFVRGWNSTAGWLDASRWFWTAQNATRVIQNYFGDGGWAWAVPDIMGVAAADADSAWRVWDGQNMWGWVAYPMWSSQAGHNAHVDAMRVRPANVALLYCVKN